jgi:hypothetical protein
MFQNNQRCGGIQRGASYQFRRNFQFALECQQHISLAPKHAIVAYLILKNGYREIGESMVMKSAATFIQNAKTSGDIW